MTSNRGEAHISPALARQPGANSPSPGAGLEPLAPSMLRDSWRTMLGFGLGCFVLGVIVGVIGFAAVLVFVFGVTR